MIESLQIALHPQAFHHGLHACRNGRTVSIEEKTDQHTEGNQDHALSKRTTGGNGPVLERQLQQVLFDLQQQREPDQQQHHAEPAADWRKQQPPGR